MISKKEENGRFHTFKNKINGTLYYTQLDFITRIVDGEEYLAVWATPIVGKTPPMFIKKSSLQQIEK